MGRNSVKAVGAIEHIAWEPDVDWFNSSSTLEHGSFLPVNPSMFKGLELQQVMEKFPTPIDFYEYQLKQSKFTRSLPCVVTSPSPFTHSLRSSYLLPWIVAR